MTEWIILTSSEGDEINVRAAALSQFMPHERYGTTYGSHVTVDGNNYIVRETVPQIRELLGITA